MLSNDYDKSEKIMMKTTKLDQLDAEFLFFFICINGSVCMENPAQHEKAKLHNFHWTKTKKKNNG